MPQRPTPVRITSFGYGHAPAPEASAVIDTRPFRNPHRDPAMRYLTGLDEPVRDHVLRTEGVLDVIRSAYVDARKRWNVGEAVHLAVGCVGGRHRSVAIAVELGRRLRQAGIPAEVVHRDVDKPVIQR